jgi:hypothetical protein
LARSENVEEKIAELKRIKDVLDRLARTCSGEGPTSECPILDMLDEEKP